MTLERRTRAVAQAGEGREYVRLTLAIIGVAFLVVGLGGEFEALAYAGVMILAYLIGTLAGNPDRRYLEGFSDGLAIAPDLVAEDGRARPTRRPEPAAPVRRLPDGPLNHDDGAAVGAAERHRREAAGTIPVDPDSATLSTAFGLAQVDRRPASPLAPDGSPVLGSGARGLGFPAVSAVPPAIGSRAARRLEAAGAPDRSKTRRLRGAPRKE